MEQILDFSQPMNVAAFDAVVSQLSTGSPAEIMRAQEILTEFKSKPDAFLRVDKLLIESTNTNTRFFALQVLDETIMRQWNVLDAANQEAIRNFVMNLIVQECTSFQRVRQRRTLLTKMCGTLVSIAKREWPVRWPSFICDICTSAGPKDPMVENNLILLRIVGEEVFQFGEKTLTSRWVERKKEALRGDFVHIMDLCARVLMFAEDTFLLKVALDTLQAYIPWMSPSLVFNEQVLARLASFVVGDDHIRTGAVRCLMEICSVTTEAGSLGDTQTQLVVSAFRSAFMSILEALPSSHSSVMGRIVQLYEQGSSVDREYVSNLNLLIIVFLRQYYRRITYDDMLLLATHCMLVGMSNIDEKELFKSCVEYWWWLSKLMLLANASSNKKALMTKLPTVLSDVRYALIKRMAKPEEVIIVEEDGELHREKVADVEELQLYELMRETLIYLTHLDPKDTRNIMVHLMERQLDLSEWSWHNCNTLSWAVGAISMAMKEEDENELFTLIVRGLLQLCKEMHGKDNRAVIASDIMFVVGQYPRYLKNHVTFLHTVSRKIFEFMRESTPGIQDMAADTFLKLARQLPDSFVEEYGGSSFAYEVAQQWSHITSLLQPQQLQTCFAAVGCMVSVHAGDRQAELLNKFLEGTNAQFKQITEHAAQSGPSFSQSIEVMKHLLNVLRIFSSIADTCGDAFINQMHLIIQDLYGFYRSFSKAQEDMIAQQGFAALKYQQNKYLSLAKREILRVFERFVHHTEHLDFVAENCMPDIFTVVLLDYESAIPDAKEAGALALAAACVQTLGGRLANDCGAILDHTFKTTVSMIADNMESYPDFRVNLFKLLQALNRHCFDAFVRYTATNEDVLGGMLWAIKHTDFPTMKTALETLDLFLANVAKSEFAEPFYTHYIQRIFVEVLVVAMDSLHAAGFPYHCSILTKLFSVSEMVPSSTPVIGREAIQSFLVSNLIVIPTLTQSSIHTFVNLCYETYQIESEFRTRFADFLIEVQVWGAEQENKLQEEEERRQRAHIIPGMVP